MGQHQRATAETLRRKYARHFGVALESVAVELFGDENAAVWAEGWPRWTTGEVDRAAPVVVSKRRAR